MRVEIWVGGMTNPAYTINDPKRMEFMKDRVYVKIIDKDGWVFETSPHNVVVIRYPEDQGGEEE